jgi:hypothetical protein
MAGMISFVLSNIGGKHSHFPLNDEVSHILLLMNFIKLKKFFLLFIRSFYISIKIIMLFSYFVALEMTLIDIHICIYEI